MFIIVEKSSLDRFQIFVFLKTILNCMHLIWKLVIKEKKSFASIV